ncbi:hypothetical protein Scep_023770 [Stephania cephalantha]|uniref:Uncharacterized protein n=1 Tax=Stephania cephalantha TaxID=152367 RepID=A0AAP0EY21_9MAGN
MPARPITLSHMRRVTVSPRPDTAQPRKSKPGPRLATLAGAKDTTEEYWGWGSRARGGLEMEALVLQRMMVGLGLGLGLGLVLVWREVRPTLSSPKTFIPLKTITGVPLPQTTSANHNRHHHLFGPSLLTLFLTPLHVLPSIIFVLRHCASPPAARRRIRSLSCSLCISEDAGGFASALAPALSLAHSPHPPSHLLSLASAPSSL